MSVYGTSRDPNGEEPESPDRGGAHRQQSGSAAAAAPPPGIGENLPASGSEAAQPVLGALPPTANQAPRAGWQASAAQRPTTHSLQRGAQAGAALSTTDSTNRLPAPQAQPASTSATATAEPGLSRQAGATLLVGSAGQGRAAEQAAAETALATGTVQTGAQAATATTADRAVEHGTVYGGGNTPAGTGSRGGRRVRPLVALRIGAHLASDAALDEIRLSASGAGVLLGHDRDRRPVQIRMFRPEPTRATLIGGLWACRFAAFRALAVGARVVIFTGQPEQWEGFGQWATGRADRVAVLPSERPITVTASSRVPTLMIYDVGLLGAANRPALGPWQTQLTVLRQLTAYGFPAVQESNLVMMQRLGNEEAFTVSSVLRLTRQATQLLGALRDDMLALVGGGADRYVWVNPTSVEKSQFGAPHR